LIKKVLKHDVLRNFSLILSGSIISQAILALSPIILARFYAPSTFGEIAVITAFVSIFATMSSWSFASAIHIAECQRDAILLYQLAQRLGQLAFIILFCGAMFVYFLPINLKIKELGILIFAIPLWSYFFCSFNNSRDYLVYENQFGKVSKYNISKSLFIAGFQIIFAFIHPTSLMLAIGRVGGDISSSFFQSRLIKIETPASKEELIKVFLKYKDFAKFQQPIHIMHNLSKHFMPFILGYFASMNVIGFFAMAMKLVHAPSTIIIDNMGKVYENRAKKYLNNYRALLNFTYKMAGILMLISLPITLVVFFFSDFIFNLFLGEGWTEAALYAKWLSPTIFFAFVSRPFWMLFRFVDQLRKLLKIHITEIATKTIIITYIGIQHTPLLMIQAFSILTVLFALVQMIIVRFNLSLPQDNG
jgi:O-antigen/teichoic acid export membrane protein